MTMLLIKVGGGKEINWEFIANDLKKICKKNKVIIIHGASSIRDEIGNKLGINTKTITSPSGISSVYTDKEALSVFMMVYPGLTNTQIVAKLLSHNINAVGLSGVDGKLWQAKRKLNILVKENNKVKVINGSYTGRVEKVNSTLIRLLIKNNFVPVISPPAISFENEIVNADNDIASSVMAGSLKIKKIVVLFEAPGLLKDYQDENSLIKKVNKNELDNFLKFAQGRMKKKILGAKHAFELGVKEIFWGDGRIKDPITKALRGNGTVIK